MGKGAEVFHFCLQPFQLLGFPGGASGKEPRCRRRRCQKPGFNPWAGKIPWGRDSTSVFLPEEASWTEEPGGL